MRLKIILTVGFAISLVACGTYKIEKINPAVPTLNPIKVDDLVCFTDQDAVKLGAYIIELEKK